VNSKWSALSGGLRLRPGAIFSGNQEGYLMALDARTGKPLWKFRTEVIIAPPITYLLNGKQYIAVAAGIL
jgi:alcohol dehydrogenase (cytochrome c)